MKDEMSLGRTTAAGASEHPVELRYCTQAWFFRTRDADRSSFVRARTARLSSKTSSCIMKVQASAAPLGGSKCYLEGDRGKYYGAALRPAEKYCDQDPIHMDGCTMEQMGDEKGFALGYKGMLVGNGLIYRQAFVIRSYELSFDGMASIQTITNLFQETSLNHARMVDCVGDGAGMGSSRAMSENKLIWIITSLHIEVEKYPIWGDVVEAESWVSACGRNGMKRDCLVRDYKSKRVLVRATSKLAMMNRDTRKLSKMPEAVRAEISPNFRDNTVAVASAFSERIPALGNDAPYVKSDLSPRIQDIDMNQHVNHVKYIDWVLEPVPQSMVFSNDLKTITLQYKRECGPLDMVESLLHMEHSDTLKTNQCTHLLRLQNCGIEVLRASTRWQPKAILFP